MLVTIIILTIICTAYCQLLITTPTSSEDEIHRRPYCFRFTWLGPKFSGDSEFRNATCEAASDVPCLKPLVVTNNSNIPDTDLMWQNFYSKPLEIACRLVRGEVCAKVSYSFNGAGKYF